MPKATAGMQGEIGDGSVILQSALVAYQTEYGRLEDTWKTLETKAQGAIAIAGIFLGGAAAISRSIDAQKHRLSGIVVVLTVLALALVVLFAVLALRVRVVAGVPEGATVLSMATDLLQMSSSELRDRMPRFTSDLIRLWRASVTDLGAVNEKKAGLLALAQVFLVASIACATILSIVVLYTPAAPNHNTASTYYEVHQERVRGGGGDKQ